MKIIAISDPRYGIKLNNPAISPSNIACGTLKINKILVTTTRLIKLSKPLLAMKVKSTLFMRLRYLLSLDLAASFLKTALLKLPTNSMIRSLSNNKYTEIISPRSKLDISPAKLMIPLANCSIPARLMYWFMTDVMETLKLSAICRLAQTESSGTPSRNSNMKTKYAGKLLARSITLVMIIGTTTLKIKATSNISNRNIVRVLKPLHLLEINATLDFLKSFSTF
jgi:hypothetical protein